MYRSCSVCGRIHPEDKMCKRVYKKNTIESKFRNTNAWIKKRNQIKKRDKYLCQLCLKDNIYTYDSLQVHHIIPIAKDYNKKLYELQLDYSLEAKKILSKIPDNEKDVLEGYLKYSLGILKED